jgi:hypothetical protein
MSETPTKLDALGELLGVEDDTGEQERPAARGPAVGDVLRGSPTAKSVAGPQTSPPERVWPPEDAGYDAAGRSVRPRRPSKRVADGVESPAGTRPGRQRTSANLPVGLVDRLREAKGRRWELSDLVVSALDHVDLDPRAADAILAASWSGTRVQRAYQLTADDLARIDAHGDRWRMNRSQVLTVILPVELDRLGL